MHVFMLGICSFYWNSWNGKLSSHRLFPLPGRIPVVQMAEATYEPSVAPQYNTDPYPKGTIRYIENMDKRPPSNAMKYGKKEA